MSNNTQAGSSGIGLGGLLTVLFVGLKLTGHIDWSWWWVFSLIWLPLVIILGLTLMVGLIAMAVGK